MRAANEASRGYRMTASTFRIVPLPTEVADAARETARRGASDHSLIEVESVHSAPCRHCLRWAEPGESVILFPYASVPQGRPYAESGPIFVHAHACERYSARDTYPPDFRQGRVLRAYDLQDNMIDAVVVNGEEPETIITRLLSNPTTAFLQVRSVTRGWTTYTRRSGCRPSRAPGASPRRPCPRGSTRRPCSRRAEGGR